MDFGRSVVLGPSHVLTLSLWGTEETVQVVVRTGVQQKQLVKIRGRPIRFREVLFASPSFSELLLLAEMYCQSKEHNWEGKPLVAFISVQFLFSFLIEARQGRVQGSKRRNVPGPSTDSRGGIGVDGRHGTKG
jgi:hypothetical protein